MNVARRWVLIIIAAGSIVGGALGGVVLNATTGKAASSNTTTTISSSNATPSGTFRPNENTGHESGESAAREAQEDAGQFPTVP
jgi:hypothetical protein